MIISYIEKACERCKVVSEISIRSSYCAFCRDEVRREKDREKDREKREKLNHML